MPSLDCLSRTAAIEVLLSLRRVCTLSSDQVAVAIEVHENWFLIPLLRATKVIMPASRVMSLAADSLNAAMTVFILLP